MNEQAIRFRIGIFVLAGLILLAVMITLFGGFPTYFKPATRYTIVFGNALGVAPGTPVRRSGVKIGEVSKVALDNDTGQVRVDIRVDAGYTLRKSDKATLVQGLLGGDTAVAFLPPVDQVVDATPVEPDSTLVGYTPVDTGTVLQKTAELMPPAQDALVEAKAVFQKLDKMTPLLEEALKEFRDVARVTREAMPELRRTNDELRELTKLARESVPDLRRTNDEIQIAVRNWSKVGERTDILLRTNEDKLVKTIDDLQVTVRRVSEVFNEENQKNVADTLRNVRAGSANMEAIARGTEDFLREGRASLKLFNSSLLRVDQTLIDVQKASKPLAERADSIVKNVDESTDKLNKLLGDVREFFLAASRNDGTLQKLVSDPSLYNNLNEAACTVTRMMPRLDRILRDVEIFADKIARHPESLGVGGVVRPGSGLKDSPTPYRVIPVHP